MKIAERQRELRTEQHEDLRLTLFQYFMRPSHHQYQRMIHFLWVNISTSIFSFFYILKFLVLFNQSIGPLLQLWRIRTDHATQKHNIMRAKKRSIIWQFFHDSLHKSKRKRERREEAQINKLLCGSHKTLCLLQCDQVEKEEALPVPSWKKGSQTWDWDCFDSLNFSYSKVGTDIYSLTIITVLISLALFI